MKPSRGNNGKALCPKESFPHFSASKSFCQNLFLFTIWGANPENVSGVLSGELTDQEEKKLDELSGFDFGDLRAEKPWTERLRDRKIRDETKPR